MLVSDGKLGSPDLDVPDLDGAQQFDAQHFNAQQFDAQYLGGQHFGGAQFDGVELDGIFEPGSAIVLADECEQIKLRAKLLSGGAPEQLLADRIAGQHW